jgi:redox-sensitive bicupin YhaK (pirin superfamily)
MDQPTDAIELILSPRPRDLGDFMVRRSLPDGRRQRIGPFIFFDHMGPVEFPPGTGVNVRPHPHIGLATITYLFDGEITHRDSLGYRQDITTGAVNWMTAGRGIVHSERTRPELVASGSKLHGIQTWVALPLEAEECEPRFEHYAAERIPEGSVGDARVRIIIGEAFGLVSPVQTASDTVYVEVNLPAGAALPVPERHDEIGVYVVSGVIRIGERSLEEGSLAALRRGVPATVIANTGARIMLLGGATLPGERIIWWNFVTSSKERLGQAKRDWKEGRFAAVPDETDFIPLPES